MKLWLATLLICLPLLASAAAVRGEGFRITLPEGWEHQSGVMNVPLMARPPRASDAEGWGQDLLTVTREAIDPKRTCLEGFTLRKLQQFAYHAEKFEKLEEEALTLPGKGGGVATRLTLRYTEGPRELMAYVLILDAGRHMLTATVTSSPARFEARRAPFRSALDSLRATAP